MRTMPISEGKMNSDSSVSPAGNQIADMAPLVRRMREFLGDRESQSTTVPAPFDIDALRNRFGFADRKKGRPEVILAEDVAVELGHPATASGTVVLITVEPDLVHQGRITIVGPDLDTMNNEQSHHPIAQVVVLAVHPGHMPDPFEVENAQFLMNRLPGYMVRSVPGRLWVRVSKKGRARGLTLEAVGSALISSYIRDFESVERAEVVFVTSSREDVEALSQVTAEAAILAGRHKKLVLGLDGEIECPELECETCDDKPVCDNLRDVVIKRRRQR